MILKFNNNVVLQWMEDVKDNILYNLPISYLQTYSITGCAYNDGVYGTHIIALNMRTKSLSQFVCNVMYGNHETSGHASEACWIITMGY